MLPHSATESIKFVAGEFLCGIRWVFFEGQIYGKYFDIVLILLVSWDVSGKVLRALARSMRANLWGCRMFAKVLQL